MLYLFSDVICCYTDQHDLNISSEWLELNSLFHQENTRVGQPSLWNILFCYKLSDSWWSAQSDQECDWSLTLDPPSHHSGLTNSPNPCPRMTNGRLCSELLSLLYWAMLAANTSGPDREGEDRSEVGEEERFQDTNMETDWGESRIHSKLTSLSQGRTQKYYFGGYFAHFIP